MNIHCHYFFQYIYFRFSYYCYWTWVKRVKDACCENKRRLLLLVLCTGLLHTMFSSSDMAIGDENDILTLRKLKSPGTCKSLKMKMKLYRLLLVINFLHVRFPTYIINPFTYLSMTKQRGLSFVSIQTQKLI